MPNGPRLVLLLLTVLLFGALLTGQSKSGSSSDDSAAPATSPAPTISAAPPTPAAPAAPPAEAATAVAPATEAAPPASPPPAAAPAVPKGLTLEDVMKLSKAGLGDQLIIERLRKNGHPFDLSPDEMLQLKTAGVSDKVMEVMLDPARADAAFASHSTDISLPDEIGVYSRRQGEKTWNDVLPEIVNWKSGGKAKNIFTYGAVKTDLNGHLAGASSKNSVTTATEFMVVVPDGVAISEYQLLRLRAHGSDREFRGYTGGVLHSSGGAQRDVVSFEGKKVAPRHYVVQLSEGLKMGEYGILPPRSAGSSMVAGSNGEMYSFPEKIYTFKVIE